MYSPLVYKKVWGRGSSVNSCVVHLPVHAWHIQQPQGIIHQSPCVWSPWRQEWLGQNCTPSPIHQGAGEGLRNHFSSQPGKKPHPSILLGYIVHVLWLLAPSRIKHSAWYSRTKSYPWTWLRISKMPFCKGKAAVHRPVVWGRSGGLMVKRCKKDYKLIWTSFAYQERSPKSPNSPL